MVLALLLFVFCFKLISRWQLYSDHSCSSEGIFAIYSIFAYGLYPWLPAELIVTRQLIHFCQSIRKLLPRKCLQQQPTHSYRPETFCSNTSTSSYAVCSTMLSVRRVNQKETSLSLVRHNYPFLQAVPFF